MTDPSTILTSRMDFEEVTNISDISNSTPQYDISTGKTDTQPEFLEPLLIFYGVMGGLFSLLALFGNLLTIVAVMKFEYLQTMTNLLICYLAICDAASGLVLFPLNAWLAFYSRSPGDLPDSWLRCCLFSEYVRQVFIMGNIYSILLIGLDRWLYLDYPLRYPIIMSHHKKKFLVCAPLPFLLFAIPTGVLTFILSVDIPPPVCSLVYLYSQSPSRYFGIIVFTCTLLGTCIIYVRITYIAVKYNTKRQAQFNNTIPTSTSHVYNKVLHMIVRIFWIYIIVYIPLMVVTVLTLQVTGWYMEYIDYAFRLIWKISTWINPMVYAWSSKDFRKAFMTILRIRSHSDTTPTLRQINFNQI